MSSSRLPGEITDHITDLLHDDPRTLKQCCLVSKSWLPRARVHLFKKITFDSCDRVDDWKRTFPNLADSPGCYTRLLSVECIFTTSVMDEVQSISIPGFPNVVRLELGADFCIFSVSKLFKLICSFPHLEDLCILGDVVIDVDDDDTHFRPSTSPPLTGTLRLGLNDGTGDVLRRLLELPNSIRFREYVCAWRAEGDIWWIRTFVERCSDTLRTIVINSLSRSPADIGLSKATRLEKVEVRLSSFDLVPTAMALKTLTHNHRDLQDISLLISVPSPLNEPADIGRIVGEETRRLWMEFDNILIQLWESKAIRVRARAECSRGREKEVMWKLMWSLLPGALKRGAVELVDDLHCRY